MEMVGEILRPDLSVANLVSQDLVSLSPTDTRKHTCKLSSSHFHVEKEENEREREREREGGFKVASHTQHRHMHTHTHLHYRLVYTYMPIGQTAEYII